MQKNRRVLAAALIAAVVTVTLAGCGSTPQESIPQVLSPDKLADMDKFYANASRYESERLVILRMEKEFGPDAVAQWQKDLPARKALAEQKAAQERAAAEQARVAAAQAKAEAEQKAAQAKAEAAKKAAEERQAAIAAANAKGVTAEDFEYDVTRDGKGIVIKRYKGLATIVNIPAVIEGFPVIELDAKEDMRFIDGGWYSMAKKGVFEGNTSITSVTIPDSVTTLGGWGEAAGDSGNSWDEKNPGVQWVTGIFYGCTSLKSVTLPRNLKTIPMALFARCTSLETITLPAGLIVIEEGAFFACSGLKTITLPDSVTRIEDGAFKDCTGLTGVVLPKNLKVLTTESNVGAFERCTQLTSVTFQSNGLIIGYNSFSRCTALSTLNINANIEVENGTYRIPFERCPISTVNIGSGVTRIRGVDSIPKDKLSIASKAALNRLR